MDRLFLDANVLFSAAYRADTKLKRLWLLPGVVLLSSRCALEEARVNLTEAGQVQRLEQLAQRLRLFDSRRRDLPAGIVLPEKDVPILMAAIESGASHLLTGDARHFGPLFGKSVQGVLVQRVGEYLKER